MWKNTQLASSKYSKHQGLHGKLENGWLLWYHAKFASVVRYRAREFRWCLQNVSDVAIIGSLFHTTSSSSVFRLHIQKFKNMWFICQIQAHFISYCSCWTIQHHFQFLPFDTTRLIVCFSQFPSYDMYNLLLL